MEKPLPRHKGVYILPNLFTTASLFAAFLAILYASNGNFTSCAIAILFSALMDGLDGKVARLTNTSSEFGVQYDSLADLVAFGVSPAFMIYQHSLFQYNNLGKAAAFLFIACSALRLARFNVTTATISKRHFIGLPTPAAGCALALLLLNIPENPEMLPGYFKFIALILTLLIAILMVSNVRYSSFKELGFFKAHPFRTLVLVSIIFALIISDPTLYGFLILYGYMAWGIVYTYFFLPRRAHLLPKNETSNHKTNEHKI